MPKYTGKDLFLSFAGSGGTVTLSTDYRSLSTNPSIGLVDVSAGADTFKTYLTTLKDGSFEYSGLLLAAGTAVTNALREGCTGTLTIGPEGTVVGKPKETYPVIALGPKVNYPYSDVVEVSATFQQNGPSVISNW